MNTDYSSKYEITDEEHRYDRHHLDFYFYFNTYPGENSFLGCYWVNVFSIIGVMLKKILGQYTFL